MVAREQEVPGGPGDVHEDGAQAVAEVVKGFERLVEGEAVVEAAVVLLEEPGEGVWPVAVCLVRELAGLDVGGVPADFPEELAGLEVDLVRVPP